MYRASIGCRQSSYVATKPRMACRYGRVDMTTGQKNGTNFVVHSHAFLPGVLAMGGDLDRARRLQDSAFRMWTLHGIEPESFNYVAMKPIAEGYQLRPEIMESAYDLSHYTGDPKYLEMGRTMFADLMFHCRTEDRIHRPPERRHQAERGPAAQLSAGRDSEVFLPPVQPVGPGLRHCQCSTRRRILSPGDGRPRPPATRSGCRSRAGWHPGPPVRRVAGAGGHIAKRIETHDLRIALSIPGLGDDRVDEALAPAAIDSVHGGEHQPLCLLVDVTSWPNARTTGAFAILP